MKYRHRCIARRALVIMVAGAAIVGCVTRVAERPAWLREAPPETNDGITLIAFGAGDDRAEADRRLEQDLAAQVQQDLLRRLDPSTVDAETAMSVERAAQRRASTLETLDEYERTTADGRREHYRLVLYAEALRAADLDAVRRRPTEAERPEAVRPPFVELADLFSGQIPTDPDAFGLALDRMLSLSSRFVVAVNDATVQQPLTAAGLHAVEVRLVDRVSDEPVADAILSVVVEPPDVEAAPPPTALAAVTDGDGRARFPVRVPRLVGDTRIVVQPEWLQRSYGRWAESAGRLAGDTRLDALRARLTVVATVRVTSVATDVPTAAVLLDRDFAGNPMNSDDAVRALTDELVRLGFNVSHAPIDAEHRPAFPDTVSIDTATLYDLLPFEVVASVDRVVVGDVRIVEFSEASGFRVDVRLTARVFDLRRDAELAEVSLVERISGHDNRATIRAAFQAAGRRAARYLAPRLP